MNAIVTRDFAGTRVFVVAADGLPIASEREAIDIIGEASGDPHEGDRVMAIPAARLAADFFKLRTGLAGGFLQKFVTYGFRVAIVGDIAPHVAASESFRAFVAESNRGRAVWFVADMTELERRLGSG